MPRPRNDTEDDGWARSEVANDHDEICFWAEVEKKMEAILLGETRPQCGVPVLSISRIDSRRVWIRRDNQEL